MDDLLAQVQRLGGEKVEQPDLEGPVGVGNVVDGVQDAADLLYHLLREIGSTRSKHSEGSATPLWLNVDSASVNQE